MPRAGTGPTMLERPWPAALQRAFLLAVPFENLDIHLRRPITVGSEHAFAKIVGAHRGGWCYECNGLFSEMLAAIGFRVTMLSARMALDGRLGPEFDHMVLQVDLETPYLVDVGNGESCRAPLRFDGANESSADFGLPTKQASSVGSP